MRDPATEAAGSQPIRSWIPRRPFRSGGRRPCSYRHVSSIISIRGPSGSQRPGRRGQSQPCLGGTLVSQRLPRRARRLHTGRAARAHGWAGAGSGPSPAQLRGAGPLELLTGPSRCAAAPPPATWRGALAELAMHAAAGSSAGDATCASNTHGPRVPFLVPDSFDAIKSQVPMPAGEQQRTGLQASESSSAWSRDSGSGGDLRRGAADRKCLPRRTKPPPQRGLCPKGTCWAPFFVWAVSSWAFPP